MTVITTIMTMAGRICFSMTVSSLGKTDRGDDKIDDLDADERYDDAADTVEPQIAAQNVGGAGRAVFHTPQAQRNERDDDQRVEDDGREDRAFWIAQPHDVEHAELGIESQEHRGDDREILGDVVGDRER